jgi:hypothetical protein
MNSAADWHNLQASVAAAAQGLGRGQALQQ